MPDDEAKQLQQFLSKIPSRDVVPIVASLLLMIILAAVAYVFIFEHAKIRRFTANDDDLTIGINLGAIGIGLAALALLFLTAYRFYTGYSKPPPAIKEYFDHAHLPIVITKKKPLKTYATNRQAMMFYCVGTESDLIGKTPLELDQLIKSKVANWADWERAHKDRTEEAAKKELRSSSIQLRFTDIHMGSREWRLTSALFPIAGEDYYLTIYSPAKEEWEAVTPAPESKQD